MLYTTHAHLLDFSNCSTTFVDEKYNVFPREPKNFVATIVATDGFQAKLL